MLLEGAGHSTHSLLLHTHLHGMTGNNQNGVLSFSYLPRDVRDA